MNFSRSLAGLSLGAILMALPAQAQDADSCKTVRLSDVGWTDITSTTAATSEVLKGLGYKPDVKILSVPVTFASLANNDIDVFLGNWMPAQTEAIGKYIDNGSIVRVQTNLEGAKYTLAVPKYLYDEGLHDFADIHKFKDQLDDKIYGIEPGNEGNQKIIDMIDKNKFDLKGFNLVASSEQGMLSQVARATKSKKAVVFLAWAPHPMNTNYNLEYLTGGDEYLRPELRRRDGLHRDPQGLLGGLPEPRQAPEEPPVQSGHGKPDHGQDPGRQGRAAEGRDRVAEGQSGHPEQVARRR